jgi:ech hydrogenase subunit D
MRESQDYAEIGADGLVAEAARRLEGNWRLVVITALQNPEGVEISYVFEKAQQLESLRLSLPLDARTLPSITGSYLAAFIYENELQDLFGVKVEGLALDFKGNFYMKAKETPFIKTVASQQPMAPSPEATHG